MAASALERLRRALRAAAADGFAEIMADDLGEQLRGATDALLASGLAEAHREELTHFRGGLDQFEARGRTDRSRVVAHGMRISMTLAAAKPPAKPRPRARPAPAAPAAGARGESPEVLPRVGAKTAAKLAAKGIHTLEDLAQLLPLGYEDRRECKSIDEVEEGERALVEGVIRSFKQGWFRRKYSATMQVDAPPDPMAPIGTPPTRLEVRWFHPVGGLGSKVTTGATILLSGQVKVFRGKLSMVHPDVLDPEAGPPGIAVRYPSVEGVGAKTIERLCHAALDRIAGDGGFDEALPAALVEAHGLPTQLEALEQLHRPGPDIDAEEVIALDQRRSRAHRRLAFDELFYQQLAVQTRRREWMAPGCAIGPLGDDDFDRERLRACLPFEPTGAQWRTLGEIEEDMGGAHPMLRLLQGDVGSGKTAVAFGAALAACHAGHQVAIMAPTEVLASQHLRTLEPWCTKADLRLALLTGAMPKAERASKLALLEAGRVDVVVGTHALLVGDVRFKSLGLVVIDEQHRFGVEQRGALRDKGGAPHLLVMTATPIPRSLALTAFGELDVSVIDEMPPGRVPAQTEAFMGRRGLGRARGALRERVLAGEKAFVVCPLVEASEAVAASDVEATAAALREEMPNVEVGVVHGRMHPKDKYSVMERFREGSIRVLVATTVIEVGVDVPDARVMLVEHAERFGLAQLHQLRGRVGRGEGASWCYLHTASESDSEAGKRLEVMQESSDGFVVAERDLELRGPGDVFGIRQAGSSKLRFDAEGLRIIEAARAAAKSVLAEDAELATHPRVAEELRRRTAGAAVHSGESG